MTDKMFVHILKDITLLNKGYILHITNTLNKMGKGIAKELYEKYPLLKTEYHDYMRYWSYKKPNPLGTNLITSVAEDLKIVSLMAQPTIETRYNKGLDMCHLNYKALEECLMAFAEVKIESLPIYIPYKMGCGNAKGDWEIVQAIIARCLPPDDVIICVKPPVEGKPKPVLATRLAPIVPERLVNDSIFKPYKFF